MKLSKKGGVDIGFLAEHLGTILWVLAIVVVILFIILVWASPSLGKSLKWFDFW